MEDSSSSRRPTSADEAAPRRLRPLLRPLPTPQSLERRDPTVEEEHGKGLHSDLSASIDQALPNVSWAALLLVVAAILWHKHFCYCVYLLTVIYLWICSTSVPRSSLVSTRFKVRRHKICSLSQVSHLCWTISITIMHWGEFMSLLTGYCWSGGETVTRNVQSQHKFCAASGCPSSLLKC